MEKRKNRKKLYLYYLNYFDNPYVHIYGILCV